MSQQLRQLKGRIKSVDGIWKVTRAMEMIALSKYKSMEGSLGAARLFFERLANITRHLTGSLEHQTHPFLASAGPRRDAPLGLFVIGSDTGLSGDYNTRLLRCARQFIEDQPNRQVNLYVLGRKASAHFLKKGVERIHVFPSLQGRLKQDFYQPFFDRLSNDYLRGEVSEVHVVFTAFQNAVKRDAHIRRLLPIEVGEDTSGGPGNFTVESDNNGILSDVLPLFTAHCLRWMMVESFTSEFSSRMVAMKASKDNAKELMGDLILLRNKVRQAVITKEVIEIISSSEALKG